MPLSSERKTLEGKANDLRQLRIRCNMSALKTDELEEFFVDTREGRDPDSSIRTSLKRILEDAKDFGDFAKVLVYGHGGCGKSTELVQLSQDLKEDFFIVRFSIDESGNAFKVTPEEIILLLTEKIISQVQELGSINVSGKHLKNMYAYFYKESYIDTQSLDSALMASTEAEGSIPILPGLVKLLAKVKADMVLSTERRKTVINEIQKNGSELIENVRLLVNEVNNGLEGDKELLVIVEDLDKLDISQARKIFVDEGMILTQIPTHIIYTIPVFLIRSDDAAVLMSRFKQRLTLPMIKTLEPDGKTRSMGFEIVKEVILKRIESSLIEEEALSLLIEKTGGLLQHAFDILHYAALLDDADIPLTTKEIRIALEKKKTQFWSEIGVPDDLAGKLTSEDLYTRLTEITQNQINIAQNPIENRPTEPSSDLVDQVLMKQAAIIQYNGAGWIGVHPLVVENLVTRGDISLPEGNE